LNRETKYFDALVRLFDLYIGAKDMQHASETFEMLVDIDPYDARNQKRFSQIEAHADPAFVSHMRSRLGQTATHSAEAPPQATQNAPQSSSGEQEPQPTLEDLMVQAEIFLQYSLQPKAVERLQRIAEFYPGEEKQNQRLRNLYQLANWSPEGFTEPQAPSAERPPSLAPPAADSADSMRDLAKISEISRALFRLPSARAILSAGINEIGTHLKVTRCIAVIGPAGKPPELASEFCAPNVEPANGRRLDGSREAEPGRHGDCGLCCSAPMATARNLLSAGGRGPNSSWRKPHSAAHVGAHDGSRGREDRAAGA
jgi:hypothetical protein